MKPQTKVKIYDGDKVIGIIDEEKMTLEWYIEDNYKDCKCPVCKKTGRMWSTWTYNESSICTDCANEMRASRSYISDVNTLTIKDNNEKLASS